MVNAPVDTVLAMALPEIEPGELERLVATEAAICRDGISGVYNLGDDLPLPLQLVGGPFQEEQAHRFRLAKQVIIMRSFFI